MPVTITDIAREAGVTPSTVSRALNGRYGISAAVRERVLAAARNLNYKPNLVARGLVTGRSQSLGLLVSDIRNPFFAEVARGAEDEANAAGYDVVLCNSDLDAGKQMAYFRSLLSKRVAGVLMNSVAALNQRQLQEIREAAIPVVTLTASGRHRFLSTVICDNFRGGYLAGEYLARLGHRRVAHLTSLRRHPVLAERARGFAKGLQSVSRDAELLIFRGPHNSRGGYEMAHRAMAAAPGITAMFAANDAVAFGAMKAIFEAGLRVPDDISLIGFDDVELAAIVHPPLTTIRQPGYEMGRAAVEILLRQADREGVLPEHRIFDVELIERQSCRALQESPAVGCRQGR
jgi:DNA-binding LacI/PurR family transcriptional regulator